MGFLEDRDLSDIPTIPEYFKGKTIFITGGSGFIGKVLIEKLLFSCTELDKIYLLLRSKRSVKSESRLAKIYSSQCFQRLRKQKPGVFESKVFVINGNVLEDDLGLSPDDRSLLVNSVNIIFHVAASVRFNDSLPQSAKMNLSGAIKILDLAGEMKNLSSLVHISTAFCNNNNNPTEEIMYPPHADWRDTLQICSSMDYETLRVLTPKYLDKVPNTYTFTKQLAEHAVYEYKGKLPIVIVRPSIVVSSIEEPMPGWIDNFNGPFGLLVASGKGISRIALGEPDVVLDYMPVDICVKNLIATAWIRGTKKIELTDDIPIYNSCSTDQINFTMNKMCILGEIALEDTPLDNIVWNSSKDITTSHMVYYIRVILQHFLPAVMIDTVLWLLGKKPMLTSIQRRIYVANIALQPFIRQYWTFKNSNFLSLSSKIKTPDIAKFSYTLDKFDLMKYSTDGMSGVRKYLLKEKDEDIPKAKIHQKRMKYLDIIVKIAFMGWLVWKLQNTFMF